MNIRFKTMNLVELLMVITVILLMISLLTPALKGALERGRQISCATNLQQLHSVVAQYQDDFYGWHVEGLRDNTAIMPSGTNPFAMWDSWYNTMYHSGYINVIRPFGKLDGTQAYSYTWIDGRYSPNIDIPVICPTGTYTWADTGRDDFKFIYSLQATIKPGILKAGTTWTSYVNTTYTMNLNLGRTKNAKDPSKLFVLYDKYQYSNQGCVSGPLVPLDWGGVALYTRRAFSRHRFSSDTLGIMNMLYHDGHVQKHGVEDATKPTSILSDFSGPQDHWLP